MHARYPLILAAIVAGSLLAGAGSQPEGRAPAEPPRPEPMDPDAIMQQWVELNRPTKEHERLERLVGEWDAEMTFQFPGTEPRTDKGVQTNTLVMDGRFLRTESRSRVMDMPMHGVSYMGYNTMTGEHESTWMDNISTAIYAYRGRFDEGNNQWEFSGEFAAGPEKFQQRFLIILVDEDHYRMEFYETFPNMPEAKTLEIRYTRRREPAPTMR